MFKSNTIEEEEITLHLIKEEFKGIIPKYTLEGYLLYHFNYSQNKSYMIIINLLRNNKICLIEKSDGDYYGLL